MAEETFAAHQSPTVTAALTPSSASSTCSSAPQEELQGLVEGLTNRVTGLERQVQDLQMELHHVKQLLAQALARLQQPPPGASPPDSPSLTGQVKLELLKEVTQGTPDDVEDLLLAEQEEHLPKATQAMTLNDAHEEDSKQDKEEELSQEDAQVVAAESLSAMIEALTGPHWEDVIQMMTEDDFWMVRAMHRALKNSKPTERDKRMLLLKVFFVAGEHLPSLYSLLVDEDALTVWVYRDLRAYRVSGDAEMLALCLTMLGNICEKPLPTNIKDKLGANLVNFLIGLALEPPDTDQAIQTSEAAFRTLLKVNWQFGGDDAQTDSKNNANRVVARLFAVRKSQELGPRLISALNWHTKNQSLSPFVLKLLKDLIQCTDNASRSFFFDNDIKVLQEILLRNLANLEDSVVRNAHLQVLLSLLHSDVYRHLLQHRLEQMVSVMEGLQQANEAEQEDTAETARLFMAHLHQTKLN
ncbi:hypothetical protein QOT17_006520 [Balamuthia mandrillaris]